MKDSVLPMTLEQYHFLGEAGLISEKTELLEGIVIAKMPKSLIHRYIVLKLYKLLTGLVSDKYVVQKEDPLPPSARMAVALAHPWAPLLRKEKCAHGTEEMKVFTMIGGFNLTI